MLVAATTRLATAAALGFTLGEMFVVPTRVFLPPALFAKCAPGDNAPVGNPVVVLHRQGPIQQKLVRASDSVFWGRVRIIGLLSVLCWVTVG